MLTIDSGETKYSLLMGGIGEGGKIRFTQKEFELTQKDRSDISEQLRQFGTEYALDETHDLSLRDVTRAHYAFNSKCSEFHKSRIEVIKSVFDGEVREELLQNLISGVRTIIANELLALILGCKDLRDQVITQAGETSMRCGSSWDRMYSAHETLCDWVKKGCKQQSEWDKLIQEVIQKKLPGNLAEYDYKTVQWEKRIADGKISASHSIDVQKPFCWTIMPSTDSTDLRWGERSIRMTVKKMERKRLERESERRAQKEREWEELDAKREIEHLQQLHDRGDTIPQARPLDLPSVSAARESLIAAAAAGRFDWIMDSSML